MFGTTKFMNDSSHYIDSPSLLSLESLEFTIKHRPFKRVFDIGFSLTVLFFMAPLMGLIALIVKISSKGDIVYAHERLGRGGKPFKCYKFRTMYQDAETRLKDILASNPELNKEWDLNHKLKNDPRVTPVGRLLRKTSLDEFPQFWNVLKGDLSVVGPRPVVRYEIIHHYGPHAAKILSIRPGLTGLWQVSGRSDTSYAYRIKLDEQYIASQSFLLDLKLILKTISCIFFPHGAY